jgi:hypothetical protein
MTLPISGILQPFVAFLNASDPNTTPHPPSDADTPHEHDTPDSPWGTQSHRRAPTGHHGSPGGILARAPELACIPPQFPPRYIEPPHPWRIALVERGECDFASKVRAAQERGAAGVVVGDMKLREGETDEEGRERVGLITMFSPGESGFAVGCPGSAARGKGERADGSCLRTGDGGNAEKETVLDGREQAGVPTS